jgi:acyl carrier protein
MTRDNATEQRLRQIMAETFEIEDHRLPDEITPEAVAGWDSLGHLRLIAAVEEAFGVRFEMERIPELVSTALFCREIESLT